MKRPFIKIASFLFPTFFTNKAFDQLTNPQVRRLGTCEMEFLATADLRKVNYNNQELQSYYWDRDGETILLIHGWEGQAGNFVDIIKALIKEGYSVVTFDGPGHGFSSKGKTSLFEFSRCVVHMLEVTKASLIISHSFGSVATTDALASHPEIHVDKYVLLTTPDRFIDRLNDVANKIGVAKSVTDRLIKKIERYEEVSIDQLNVRDFVSKASVKQALILHDQNDQVVAIEQAIQVSKAWPAARLEIITGTGHFRILRDSNVIQKIIKFLKE